MKLVTTCIQQALTYCTPNFIAWKRFGSRSSSCFFTGTFTASFAMIGDGRES